MDLAVEVAPMNYKETYKSDLETVDVEIREAFLHYFATILGHYRYMYMHVHWDATCTCMSAR